MSLEEDHERRWFAKQWLCMCQVGKARRRSVCCNNQESLADPLGSKEGGTLETRAVPGAHILFWIWLPMARCWLLR
jgi:hypothetical protein